jgi:hypothetical protein
MDSSFPVYVRACRIYSQRTMYGITHAAFWNLRNLTRLFSTNTAITEVSKLRLRCNSNIVGKSS